MTTPTRTPKTQGAILTALVRVRARIVGTRTKLDALYEEQNELFVAGKASGLTNVLMGEAADIKPEAVRQAIARRSRKNGA